MEQRLDDVSIGVAGRRDGVGHHLGAILHRPDEPVEAGIERLLPRQRRHRGEDLGQSLEEGLRRDAPLMPSPAGEIRQPTRPRPVVALRRPVELCERIGDDLVDRRQGGQPILLGAVDVDARQAIAIAGGAAEHRGDPGRDRAAPVGPDDEIAPRLRAMHPPDPGEGVGAVVAELIEPEAIAEIGDLDDDRILGQIKHPEAVDHILVRTGNDGRPRPDDVGEHRQAVDRSDRDPAAPPRGRHALERRAAVVEIDQRPAPHVGLPGGAAELIEPDRFSPGAVRDRGPGDRRGTEGTRPAQDQRKRDNCQKDR